jgi:hypothetical protein
MISRRSVRARLGIAIATLVAALPVAGLTLPLGVFAASPPPPTNTCNASYSGQIRYTTSISSKTYARALPDVIFSIAPGQTSGTRTVTGTRTFTGNVTVSGSVAVSTSAVIASAEAKVGLDLMLGQAFSSSDSWTVGPYHNTTSTYRDAVAFVGTRVVNGYYTKWKCGLSPSTGFYTWLSQTTNVFDAWNDVVAALVWCDDDALVRSQYGTWSIHYDAASRC